jgi:glutathione synthase/RimK-type ligase-like ATP-grasp enzyme
LRKALSVLILSSPTDVHSAAVEQHLAEMGLDVIYWRPQIALTESVISFSFHRKGFDCWLEYNQSKERTNAVSLEKFKSVWLRRPGLVKSKRMPEIWIERLAEHESSRAIEGIFRLLPCFWVNHPLKQQEAMLKIHQLELARQCGLTVPETIVTNDPEKVTEFYGLCKGEMIYKFIDSRSGQYFPLYELPRSIPTLPFRQTDLEYLDQVRSCLHLFQRRVAKISDIRLTVIGRKVFAAEIRSQDGGELLDWRLDRNLPVEKFKLPNEIEEQSLLFMDKLGLSYAALDFCRTPEGEMVFLEANPDGQFLWIEEALNLPMSYELARLLAGKETLPNPSQ